MALTRQISRRTLVLSPTNAEVSTNQVYTPRYEFLVDGELSLPVPRVINSLKHQDAAATIYRVDVSVNKGGTSQYQVVITSYDQLGANPIVHVDQFVTLTTDRLRTTIPVTNAAVGNNRSLECTITETNALVPAQDMTVTVIMENFSDLEVARNGHQIMDEDENVQAQKEVLQFVGAVEVSEDTVNQRTVIDIGAVGEVKPSMLTEAQMQTLYGTSWILADGRSVAGSRYALVTGETTIPDMRGMVLRGKNNGRNDGFEDSEGERALGSFQEDAMQPITGTFHHRTFREGNAAPTGAFTQIESGTAHGGFSSPGLQVTINSALVTRTAPETRAKNIAVNYFIKIN